MTPPYGLAPSSRVAVTLPEYYAPATSSLGGIYQNLNDLETLLPQESVENRTHQPRYLQDCTHDPMITGSTPQDNQATAAGTRERVDVARPHSAHTHDTTSAKGLSRNDMIRADYGVNNTLTQALRENKNTSWPTSSVPHQRQFTSDNTQTSTTIAPHAQISSKLNMKRLTTEYVSTRGLTQQHFEHAMHLTFTGSHVKLKRYQTPGRTTYGLEQTGPLQDVTIWPTDEPELGRSNIQVQWSCSVILDSRNLTAVPNVDDEGSLTVQSITQNSSNPFKPVKLKSGNGTVLYKIRQAFMDGIGAQMSSAKATKIPTSLISYERSVNRVMGYQGSITSKAGSRGRQTKLTVPLQVEVSIAFSAKS
ncbi:hypothetical protein L486_01623 [Kwoniella mangroviensis CBS 10435]|uniref:Uncharacterized protein n=1 Tax=Kwoniella mangroviensis CBS 10435 TaxID=1331196 RepID=A0A1B9J2E0_9TREE|nr:hypothetical protein L486_01623 [Kwoniella mangroviensis CBS 10435]